MLRAIAINPARKKDVDAQVSPSLGTAVLQHDERHLRRKAINLTNGSKVLVDFPEPVVLVAGDELVLDNGAVVLIVAAEEPLFEITARSNVHLAELAWHIGNRHLPADIATDRILILRDHVIKAMLEGLGATVHEIVAPFNPVRGAYAGHAHAHDQHKDHAHSHHHHD
jgi:urease accessory protein